MLKSAPKGLKLMPEILQMPIFVTQFNFKTNIDKSTKCAQIKLKSKKTCAQNRYKNTGCKGFCAMERPHNTQAAGMIVSEPFSCLYASSPV
jgi:hypothetical protein